MTRLAGFVAAPGGKPRLVLLSKGRQRLAAAGDVLRLLHKAGGDAFCEQLAIYLDKVSEKHGPPARLSAKKPRTDHRAQQQPRGDA